MVYRNYFDYENLLPNVVPFSFWGINEEFDRGEVEYVTFYDLLEETLKVAITFFAAINKDTFSKVSIASPQTDYWKRENNDNVLSDLQHLFSCVPVYLKNEKETSDYSTDTLGAYIPSIKGEAPHIELYILTILQAAQNSKEFIYLFSKVLIHEFMHAWMDCETWGYSENNLSKANYRSKFGNWREESCANLLTGLYMLYIEGTLGDAVRLYGHAHERRYELGMQDFTSYSIQFMKGQPKQYALGAHLLDNFMDSNGFRYLHTDNLLRMMRLVHRNQIINKSSDYPLNEQNWLTFVSSQTSLPQGWCFDYEILLSAINYHTYKKEYHRNFSLFYDIERVGTDFFFSHGVSPHASHAQISKWQFSSDPFITLTANALLPFFNAKKKCIENQNLDTLSFGMI